MKILDQMERRIAPYAVTQVLRYVIAIQIVFFILSILRPGIVEAAALIPSAVLDGEIWRIVSFVFIPPVVGIESVGSVIAGLFYWWVLGFMGSSLEQHWGAARLNLFLLIGYVATVGSALLGSGHSVSMQNYFIYGTTFLAFARVFPDFSFHLYLILPVKVKWLALLAWIILGLMFLGGGLMTKLGIAAAVSNYLLFFGGDIIRDLKQRKRRAKHVALARDIEEAALHTCSVCGATEESEPGRDFRYDDAGTCFCDQHLGT